MSQVSDFPQLSQFCYVPELFGRFSGYLSIGGVGGGVRLIGITGPSMYIFFSQLRKSSSEQTPWKKCEDKFTFPHT